MARMPLPRPNRGLVAIFNALFYDWLKSTEGKREEGTCLTIRLSCN